MARLKVTCITKREHYNPHERITSLGGIDSEGASWYKSQEIVINEIRNDINSFYTIVNGVEAKVEAVPREGRYYLRTDKDDFKTNNLLSLPDCSKAW